MGGGGGGGGWGEVEDRLLTGEGGGLIVRGRVGGMQRGIWWGQGVGEAAEYFQVEGLQFATWKSVSVPISPHQL